MVDIARRFAILTARPPTPPRDCTEQSVDTSSPNSYFAHIANHILLDTPTESPSSSAEYFAGSSERGAKKVEFSPWLKLHDPMGTDGKSPVLEGDLRRLPPSRHCKSSRSILKPSVGIGRSSPMGNLTGFDDSNFPRMIQSILAHLRSPSRMLRLDAYSALIGSLSAYDDLPNTGALVENLEEFTADIRRDIAVIADEDKGVDTQLATQSLKLLAVFLCTPVIAESIPDDFRIHILDKAISSLEDTELPKVVIIHYLQVLAKQNFSGKHMTSERAKRLINILKGIVDRTKGNSIIGLRLRVYGRLLIQTKHTLAANAADWIDHLVSGMLSTTKEIRSLAISFGLDAAMALGTTPAVSQLCFEMFNRKSPTGQTVVEFLSKRLNSMTASKDNAVQVPQIWSVLILFLRNRRRQFEHWQHLKPWMRVIQKCLNSNDPPVKFQAMTAWNRLVLTLNIDTATSPRLVDWLRAPIVFHLNRKGGDKTTKLIRQLAHSSYCNLLYYAFRPSATHAQLDVFWEQYVDNILPESFSSSKRDVNQASAILAALLHTPTPKPWDENRAAFERYIKPDELPCIDSKWTRACAAKVIKVFERLIDIADWTCTDNEKSSVILAWESFTAALGDSSKQEVKVSFQIMTAVAEIINMLAQYWDRAYVRRPGMTATEISIIFGKVRSMIQIGITNIGPITFNEQRLLWTSLNRFEAAETPSSRPSKQQGTLSSPVIHLLRLLVSTIQDADVTEDCKGLLHYLLETVMQSNISRGSQLDMLSDLTTLVASNETKSAGTHLWQLIAKAASEAVKKSKAVNGVGENFQHAGREYISAIRVLEVGVRLHSSASFEAWQTLQSAVCDTLNRELGRAGIPEIMTEPLSPIFNQMLAEAVDGFLLKGVTSLFQSITWSQTGKDIDRAKRLLWGMPNTNQRSNTLPPSENLCVMVNCALTTAYASYAQLDQSLITDLLETLTDWLRYAPQETAIELCKQLQSSVGLWIEDAHGILPGTAPDPNQSGTQKAIRNLWAWIMPTIERLPHNSASLESMQEIMTCSLRSRHRAIVNEAIGLWNRSYGTSGGLEYSDALQDILARLRSIAVIELPNFPDVGDVNTTIPPLRFIDSPPPEEREQPPFAPRPLTAEKSTTVTRKLSTIKPSARPFQASPRVNSPQISVSLVSKTPQKTRPRHDDSQVIFAAIGSSSPLAPEYVESQIITDHQKEIRERQASDMAMFPDLSSSPQAPTSIVDRDLPRLMLSGSKHHHKADVDFDEQVSPTFGAIDGLMESFLGSSPTPRSGRKGVTQRNRKTSRSSSSQRAATHAETDGEVIPAAPLDDIKASENKELEDETLRQSRALDSRDDPTLPDRSNDSTRIANHSCDVRDAAGTALIMSSGVEVFVDAPGRTSRVNAYDKDTVVNEVLDITKLTSHLAMPRDDGDSQGQGSKDRNENKHLTITQASDDETISRITDSFQSQSSMYSKDEEQISAQLTADMERASSQAQLADSNRKRRRSLHEPSRRSKRVKYQPRAQSCHVLVERQGPRNRDEDCIIVDTRTAIESPGQPQSERQMATAGDAITGNEVAQHQRAMSDSLSKSNRACEEMGLPAQKECPITILRESIGDQTSAQPRDTIPEQQHAEVPLEPRKRLSRHLKRLEDFLEDLKRDEIDSVEEERAMTNKLFECVKEVHEAGRRRGNR